MIKSIALVAHDSRKNELVEWVKYNKEKLSTCELYATGTTGKLIENAVFTTLRVWHDENGITMPPEVVTEKEVHKLLSGPLGGDAQISAMIAEGKIDCLIFFCDNLIIQGHNSDVQGLSRLASLYNVAYATNRTTADMIISSPLMTEENYQPIRPACIDGYASRQLY